VVGVLKDLPLGRAAGSGFLLGLLPAGILHFAFVKTHGRIVRGKTVNGQGSAKAPAAFKMGANQ
jgi:hypothetical protein